MKHKNFKTKDRLTVDKIERLLEAGFPVSEISKFLNLTEEEVLYWKVFIDLRNKLCPKPEVES